jgi:hypothetical protein
MNSVLLLDSVSDPRSGRERQGAGMDELGQLQAQVATLTSDVEYIKKDIADVKVDLRRLNDKLDAMDARLYRFENDVTEKFGAINVKFASMKLWFFGLYVTQTASLLLIMVKGFKWL